MVGMLQIITYLLCFYLIIKGIEILQIALSSTKENKRLPMIIGITALIACVIAALYFCEIQDQVASSIARR